MTRGHAGDATVPWLVRFCCDSDLNKLTTAVSCHAQQSSSVTLRKPQQADPRVAPSLQQRGFFRTWEPLVLGTATCPVSLLL